MKTLKLSTPILVSFSSVWKSFLKIMSRCAELKVWQRTDRSGNRYWHGYDPHHQEYVSFGSEDEIRMWIEQRYYR